MHQSLVKFSESEASNHTPSLADFTTTTPELKFSVHTAHEIQNTRWRRRKGAVATTEHPLTNISSRSQGFRYLRTGCLSGKPLDG